MTSLDATAGEKKWPEQADIRIDINPRSPDVIKMDATDLKFPDSYFDEIYFRPPYCINPGRLRLLGRWAFFFKKGDWERFLKLSSRQFWRCLKADGRLICNVDEGAWFGMAHYNDMVTNLEVEGWMVDKDETAWLGLDFPYGNHLRHIITFRKT